MTGCAGAMVRHSMPTARARATSTLRLSATAASSYFIPTGFFVPGVHSRPLSDEDPDIAPDLVPLRRQLMDMVKRPVNLQASRNIVIGFRGDLLDQPYLTLFTKPEGLRSTPRRRPHDVSAPHLQHPHGGVGRMDAIAKVINACAPDLVLLQEATDPSNVERLAEASGMADGATFASSRSAS